MLRSHLPALLTACIWILTPNRSMPDETHEPKDKLSVLIVDGFSNHDWRQTTSLVRGILEGSGLFSVKVSTSPPRQAASGWETWRPRFSDFDVVVQNCNSIGGGPAWPRAVQRDLERYVQGGGRLYILHSANNAFPEWEAYNRMIGLGWRGQDFGWALTLDDLGVVTRVPPGEGDRTSHGKRLDAVLTRIGEHPIHRNLPRRWKAADLEIYRYARGPAENLTVLSFAKDPQTGLNFPIEWVVQHGQGTIYNSTFGHVWDGDTKPAAIRCVAFQTLLIRAVEWLGSGAVTWPAPADFPDEHHVSCR